MSHKLNETQNIGNMLANQMSIFTTFFAMAPSSGQNELIHVTLTFLRFLTKIFNQKFREMLKNFQTAFNFSIFFFKNFRNFSLSTMAVRAGASSFSPDNHDFVSVEKY